MLIKADQHAPGIKTHTFLQEEDDRDSRIGVSGRATAANVLL